MADLALKWIGDDRVGGYLVLWGSPAQKDLTGEYFTPDTELGLDWYDRRPALYHHGLDGTMKASVIGVIDTLKTDDVGVWAEAQLDMRNRYVQAVQKLVDRGALGWSSGSLPHLVVVKSDGRIERWPIVEGSLTPAPAEPRISVSNLKSLWDELELVDVPLLDTELGTKHLGEEAALKSIEGVQDLINLEELATKAVEAGDETRNADGNAEAGADTTEAGNNEDTATDTTKEGTAGEGVTPVTTETGSDTGAGKAVEPPPPDSSDDKPGQSEELKTMDMIKTALAMLYGLMEVKPTGEQDTQIYTRVKALLTERTGTDEPPQPAVKTAFMEPGFVKQAQDIVNEVFGKTEELENGIKSAFGKNIDKPRTSGYDTNGSSMGADAGGQGQKSANIQVSTKYHNLSAADMSYLELLHQMHARKRQQMWIAPVEFVREAAEKAVREVEKGTLEIGRDLYPAVKAIHAGAEFRRGMAIKDDELSHSTQAGFGDEFVPTLWSDDVWRLARLDNVIFPLFRTIDMPSNPYIMPVEGADPTVSFVPETTNEAQLTLSGSGSVIPDSKLATANVTLTAKKLALRVGLGDELVEDSIIPILSHLREKSQRVLLDAVDNVLLNGDDTNEATGNINSDDADPADTQKYLAFNGLLHSALVEDTARKLDFSGLAPTLATLRQLRFKMLNKYALRPSDLAWLVPGEVYAKLLGLDEFITMDKAGALATALTGQIGFIDGIPVLASAEFGLAEADGKLSATPGNNTLGRAACVYKPNFVVGFRRRIMMNLDYLAYYDAYQMTASVRLAFTKQDNDSVSVGYDIAV